MMITDEILQRIKLIPKSMRLRSGPSAQKGSTQWAFDVTFPQANILNRNFEDMSLQVFARQNNNEIESFSCGIMMLQNGKKIMLSRYNGSDHVNAVAQRECHIHNSTAESINREDRKPEHIDTKVTDRYSNIDGAFECLRADYHITLVGESQLDIFGERLP